MNFASKLQVNFASESLNPNRKNIKKLPYQEENRSKIISQVVHFFVSYWQIKKFELQVNEEILKNSKLMKSKK